MSQRKFRNRQERQAIREEVVDGLDRIGVIFSQDLKPFVSKLNEFVESTNGYTFEGRVELKDVGIAIDYMLPGRRIVKQVVKASKIGGPDQETTTTVPNSSSPCGEEVS